MKFTMDIARTCSSANPHADSTRPHRKPPEENFKIFPNISFHLSCTRRRLQAPTAVGVAGAEAGVAVGGLGTQTDIDLYRNEKINSAKFGVNLNIFLFFQIPTARSAQF